MNVNPQNDDIYGLESAADFSSNGYMHVYDKNGVEKQAKKMVGIGPNAAIFN